MFTGIGGQAPVFAAAVLEYVVAELLELAGNAARAEKKNRVKAKHLQLAIADDEELKSLFGNVTIRGGGVSQGIHNFLQEKSTPKKLEKKKAKLAKKKAALAEAADN